MSEKHLRVFLQDHAIGQITLAKDQTGISFRFLDSYKNMEQRPVLGQIFLDNLDAIHHRRQRLHAWFSNLLPGRHPERANRQASRCPYRKEFFLLSYLGEDLAGAVRVIPETRIALYRGQKPSDPNNPPKHPTTTMKSAFLLQAFSSSFPQHANDRGLPSPPKGAVATGSSSSPIKDSRTSPKMNGRSWRGQKKAA